MKKKNSAGLTRKMVKIALVIPALFSLSASLIAHLRFEAISMRKRIVWLFLLGILFFVMLLSLWLCGISLFVAYMISLQMSLMLALSLALVINLLLLTIVCLLLASLKIDPSFPETRKMIKEIISS